MNPKKEKGRRLELKVARLIREKLGIKAYRTPLSGGAQGFKGDIFCPNLPFYWELKNREYISIWGEWQKIRDCKNPILVISGAHKPILAIMDFEMFLELIQKLKNNMQDFKQITLKEGFIDLYNRMIKMLAEKVWEIERIKRIKDKSDEWYDFAGPGAIKEKVLAKLERELKEREKNLKVLEEIIKCH